MANLGTTTIDFGSAPGSNEASIAVTGQASILSTSYVEAWVMGDDTTADHTASDHKYVEVVGIKFTCGTPINGVGFTIYGRCIDKMQGTFSIRWTWV